MPGLTKDRGCMYYVPWIALLALSLLIGGIGVWIHYSNQTRIKTEDGLNVLSVATYDLSRTRPALIATSCFYLVVLVMLALLSFARSFIEAAHDATGQTGAGSTAWMVLNAVTAVLWWALVLWGVVLIMGCTLWAGLIWVMRETLVTLIDKYGSAEAVSWLPLDNTPCPGQCLNLTYFTFISADLKDSCVCDYTKLRSAEGHFHDAYNWAAAMIIGVWAMWLAGFILLVNFACQFSHTKREKEYITRLMFKQFIGV